MATGISLPDQMDFSILLDESWQFFKLKFDLHLKASDLVKKSSEMKCSILLSCIGNVSLKIYNQFVWNEAELKMDFDTVINKFENFFKPEKIQPMNDVFFFYVIT